MQTEMVQLTKWARPTERLTTQYGLVTISEWLTKEKERIERRGDRIAIIKAQVNKKGFKERALFVDGVAKN